MPKKNDDIKTKSRGLGKGIGALFEGYSFDEDIKPVKNDEIASEADAVTILKIRDVEPNKNQPRKSFDQEKLEALSDSIKNHGIVQPILVKKQANGMYVIIAGERRWRAAKKAGLKEIPCIIKDYDNKELMEIALIENLQREDLNPIEEAEGYKNLMETFNMRQEDIASRVGKSRSAVANSLRLNNLADEIKKLVLSGKLSQGHARTLLALKDKKAQLELSDKIIKEELSVRKTEQLVSLFEKTGSFEEVKTKKLSLNKKYYQEIENTLTKKFGTKVKISEGKTKNKIEIEYYSKEDLERILFELS